MTEGLPSNSDNPEINADAVAVALPTDFDVAEPLDAHLAGLQQAAVEALASRGLAAEDMLFAGYNPNYAKASEGEFASSDGGYQFFFGDVRSLGPAPADDVEDLGDRWMANPIRYATSEGGLLGVYSREALAPFIDPTQTDVDFGTYVATATPAQVATCQTMAIQFTR